MGANVGIPEGDGLGCKLGIAVGVPVGIIVGTEVGGVVGTDDVGLAVGGRLTVGTSVGKDVGQLIVVWFIPRKFPCSLRRPVIFVKCPNCVGTWPQIELFPSFKSLVIQEN